MNRQQVTLTLCQRRKFAAYRAAQQQAIRTAERTSYLCRRASRPLSTPRPKVTSRGALFAIVWALVLASGIWLAAHDPHLLSRVVQRVVGAA
jgi:hypothetical protein